VCSAVRSLKSVARNVNLLGSEAVKGYLSAARFSPSRKEALADHLARFYRYKNIPLQKPRYRREDRVPFMPLESEIDQLIAGSTSKVAAFLQLLKETGMRPGEAWNRKWTDIDIHRNAVNDSPILVMSKPTKPIKVR
jgi:integrase